MRYAVIILIFGLFFLWACNKNVSSTPSLSYKSATNTIVIKGQQVQLKFAFTDKEADLDSIWVQKVSTNCTEGDFESNDAIPEFPARSKGNILLTYGYAASADPAVPVINGCTNFPDKDDTCVFRVVIRDKAGNKSDTAISEQIVLLH
jgi:hypothetical protein